MTANATDEYFDGFAWAVPVAFADPLAACRFEQGDILYDTRQAYQGTWGEALPHIKYSLQVKSPMRGPGTKSEKEEESVFTDNWNMTVVFTLTDYKANKRKEITTTQGRLYSLLWKGDLARIEPDAPTPELPTLAMQILRDLPKAKDHVRENVDDIAQGDIVFLMPFDRTRQLLRTKFRKVEEALTRLNPLTCSFSPADAGLQTASEFAPTVSIACFAMRNCSSRDVEKALKHALYTPSKEKKTDKEQFRITAHGHLFTK
jgi:hypothetical protein